MNQQELIEWRNRNLNRISKSFCAAKWFNASIYLGHGFTSSCHLPLPHPISLEEIKKNPSAVHNTEHKKEMRKMMLKGIRPAECSYCWKIEDIGRDNVSDRVFKSGIYSEEQIAELEYSTGDEDIILKTVEISFDSTCNFACSYCNAGYSTTWANEIKKFGPYQQLISDGGGVYQADGSWAEPFGKHSEDNPYVKAFLEWWPELSRHLLEIRITGGEPLLSHNFWKFVETVKEYNSPDLRFAVNSNMGMEKDVLHKLVDLTHTLPVKEFFLFTSNEAYGKQAEYIRGGLDYEKWKNNLIYFIENANDKAEVITIMMTINSLCLFSIVDFLEDMIELKIKYGNAKPYLDFNILRWPSFMSPLALPDHLKVLVKDKLSDWYLKYKSDDILSGGEKSQIERLLDYMDVVEKGHHTMTENKEYLFHDFKSFYEQYDERRGFNFKKTFPEELVKWYDTLKINKKLPVVNTLYTGEITHYETGEYGAE